MISNGSANSDGSEHDQQHCKVKEQEEPVFLKYTVGPIGQLALNKLVLLG
jgi:hypothetical protein